MSTSKIIVGLDRDALEADIRVLIGSAGDATAIVDMMIENRYLTSKSQPVFLTPTPEEDAALERFAGKWFPGPGRDAGPTPGESPEDCQCGYGGFHEELNKRCPANTTIYEPIFETTR